MAYYGTANTSHAQLDACLREMAALTFRENISSSASATTAPGQQGDPVAAPGTKIPSDTFLEGLTHSPLPRNLGPAGKNGPKAAASGRERSGPVRKRNPAIPRRDRNLAAGLSKGDGHGKKKKSGSGRGVDTVGRMVGFSRRRAAAGNKSGKAAGGSSAKQTQHGKAPRRPRCLRGGSIGSKNIGSKNIDSLLASINVTGATRDGDIVMGGT